MATTHEGPEAHGKSGGQTELPTVNTTPSEQVAGPPKAGLQSVGAIPGQLAGLMSAGPMPGAVSDGPLPRAREELDLLIDSVEAAPGDLVWVGDVPIPDPAVVLTWPAMAVLTFGTTGHAWLLSDQVAQPSMLALVALANVAATVQLIMRDIRRMPRQGR